MGRHRTGEKGPAHFCSCDEFSMGKATARVHLFVFRITPLTLRLIMPPPLGFRGTISPVPSGFSPAVITAGTKEQPSRTHKRIKQYASERSKAQDFVTKKFTKIRWNIRRDQCFTQNTPSIAPTIIFGNSTKIFPLARSVSNNGIFQQDTRNTTEKDDVKRGHRTESENNIEHTRAQSEWHRIDRLAFEREPAGSNGQSANRPIDVAVEHYVFPGRM
ncbi:unnamed protein product [Heterotrigona itama]|uniref:Uncharacterized protein n=1 Tax=Heterotrigona itama TaxID=395501 RepID=A0A6V7H8G9_9HYME|nr:unnamed protein product [Heterotrigona itama]